MKRYLIFSRFILPVLFTLFIASCEQPTEQPLPVNQVQKLTNVSYGTDARNKMDVYLPANRTTETPLVILIHGGAWVSGDKSLLTDWQNVLLAEGIASVNINYRFVSSSVHCDELMQDVDKVVQYCLDNSEKWQVRNSNLMIGGHSAGAHISLMYGYAYDKRNVIGGIINASGPTNLYDETLLDKWKGDILFYSMLATIENLADAKYTEGEPIPENFRKISPITRIKNVPTLMIHGTADELVAYSTVLDFQAELNKKGVANKLFAIETANHSFTNITAEKSSEMNWEMINWINLYGK